MEFSFCCHPKMGDEIVGFLDKKKVVLHHKLCSTAIELIHSNQEMVFVEWVKENHIGKYFIVVHLQNKKGELAKFLNELVKLNISITSIELGINSELCQIGVELDDKNLEKTSNKLKQNYKIIEFTSSKDAYNGKVKM